MRKKEINGCFARERWNHFQHWKEWSITTDIIIDFKIKRGVTETLGFKPWNFNLDIVPFYTLILTYMTPIYQIYIYIYMSDVDKG